MELRYRGYLRALAEAGLPADPRLYGEVAYAGYRQHVCDTLARILGTVPDTDAFFFTPASPSKRSAPTPCASCCGKSAKTIRPAPSARLPNR